MNSPFPKGMAARFFQSHPHGQLVEDTAEGHVFEESEGVVPGQSVPKSGRAANAAEESGQGAGAAQGGMLL